MTALAVHMVLPGHKVAEAQFRARETVAGFLRRIGWSFALFPTICVVDGKPVLRRDWRKRRVKACESVVFLSRPRGGGGGSSSTKSVVGLVGLIALAALAPWAGGLAATALGFGATGVVAGALAAGFVAGGSFLLSTFLTPAQAQAETGTAAALYSFNAQSNSARPLEPVPVKYGRTKAIPDYAAVPWSEFIGDDQYLNLLLVNGCGRYFHEQILIEDTVLWDRDTGLAEGFEGVEFQFCEPGEDVTLFPLNVAASVEVSGQELADEATWIGGFVANAAGTSATALALDFVLPSGLYFRGTSGALSQYLCSITAQYRPVNSSGAPTGDWAELFHHERWGASEKPLRFSIKTEVPAGRYEVRCKRDVPEDFATTKADTLIWGGLRAFLTGPRSFAGVTVTAIRMKSTAQLTAASSGKFGVIDTRILPVWTGSGWDDQPTRSPAYAAFDIATNADYGCRRPASKVDVQGMVSLATKAAARGDCFDYEFRAAVPAADALDTALATVRAKHRWLGDVISVIRDEWRPVPQMLITDRELVRNSFSVEYQFQASDSTDAVIVRYLDEETWTWQEVQVPADIQAVFPKTYILNGIVQRAQAFREATFLWRQNAFRRVLPVGTTEHDGALLGVGSVVALQSEMPMEWGSSGAVVGRAGLMLTLDPPPPWASGQAYVLLRSPTGAPFGPVKIAQGSGPERGLLDSADLALVEMQQGLDLDAVLERHPGSQPPSFAWGMGTDWQQRCIVLSGMPDGDHVRLNMVVDYEDVHDDSGDAAPVPPSASLSNPKTPLVAGLFASLSQNVLEPILSASWVPAAGAFYYIAQVSYDGRVTWAPLAQVYANSLSVVVEPRAMSLRVAAVGAGQGAWSVVDLEAPTIDAGRITIDWQNFAEGVRDQIAAANDGLNASLADIANSVARVTAVTQMARLDLDRKVVATSGALEASITQESLVRTEGDQALATMVDTVAATAGLAQTTAAAVSTQVTALADSQSAIATSVTTLSASVGGISSTVDGVTSTVGAISAELTTQWVAVAAPSGATAAYTLRVKAGSSSAGLHVVASSSGDYVAVDASKFLLRNNAGVPFAVFAADAGNVYVNGNYLGTGTVTSPALASESVTTSKIVLNGVTTTRIEPASVVNYVASYAASSLDAGTLATNTLARSVSGTSVDISASFALSNFQFSSAYGGMILSIDVVVTRDSGGGESTIYSRREVIPILYRSQIGSTHYVVMGGTTMVFSVTDTASLAPGTYVYRLKVTNIYYDNGSATGNLAPTDANGFENRYLKTAEFKR